MISVQTGNMLDVVVQGKSIGLQQRGSDHVIWLPNPDEFLETLETQIHRFKWLNNVRGNPQPEDGVVKLFRSGIPQLSQYGWGCMECGGFWKIYQNPYHLKGCSRGTSN